MRSLILSLLIVPLAVLLTAASRRGEAIPTKYPAEPGTFKSTQAKAPHQIPPRIPDTPGYYIPDDAATANFKVVDSINGKKVTSGSVRLFAFDEVGRGSKLGEIQTGTLVTLKGMRTVDKTIFYAIPWEGKIAWINGYFLAPAK